jgi:putative ABC transport system ATP-binding protein/macrolide transport system ATP-binding/permease protein/lipoprotein-releasing system ATP-binding protein
MMLQAHNLSKTYAGDPQPVHAVAGVSLAVAPGEFVAICGRSGSGKSTLLALLAGLTPPSDGTVFLDGTDLFALSPHARTRLRRSQIGVAFQFAGLLPTLRAIDNVAFPALVKGSAEGIDPYPRAAELLAQVGLAQRMEAYPHQLSGGEQRRVALARALINRPPLLLCDEPTNDLDGATAAEVLALLLELHQRHGTALVVVTHDEAVAHHADRILHLERGRLEQAAAPPPLRVPRSVPIVPLAPATAIPPIATQRLGAGFGKLLRQFVVALALGSGAVAAADWGTAVYRRHQQDQRLQARRLLEETALQRLRADLSHLSTDADGAYSVAVYLQNLDAETPLFVTAPAVRAFVQVDRDWVEIPARSADREVEDVLRLSGKQLFQFHFKPEVAHYTELLPGYMHVRLSNTMLISRDRHGAGGLFERTDDYYIYLKPHDANDALICRRNQWTSAPLWIPMPPH